MTKLLWDQVGSRSFETGVDRGVLYLTNGSGVAWNGITSIDQSTDESSNPLYIDGIKYIDDLTVGDYQATLSAFTYPDEFMEFDGVVSLGQGLYVGDQNNSQLNTQFGLSYRTRAGNDADGTDHGYKIHVVWNLTASQDAKTYATLAEQQTPAEFTWQLTSVPEDVSGYVPTAHVVIDSTLISPYLLSTLEDILYGNTQNAPRLPSLTELVNTVQTWALLTITDNGDGTWTATGPDNVITMTDSTTFQIVGADATFTDSVTYQITNTYA